MGYGHPDNVELLVAGFIFWTTLGDPKVAAIYLSNVISIQKTWHSNSVSFSSDKVAYYAAQGHDLHGVFLVELGDLS